jgi:hypothetical protein
MVNNRVYILGDGRTYLGLWWLCNVRSIDEDREKQQQIKHMCVVEKTPL